MFTDSVRPEALELLRRLTGEPLLSSFRLVGGAAIALQRGHRISEDLVFFEHSHTLPEDLEKLLIDSYNIEEMKVSGDRGVIAGVITGVKVDFIAYPYSWLAKDEVEQDIRFADMSDIAAMKVSAIGQRGTKKDFYDLAELLNIFSLKEVLDLFKRKFPHAADLHYLQSIVYFDDAERDPDPLTTVRTIAWEKVKTQLSQAVRDY